MAARFLHLSAIYLVVGACLGMYMGITQNFSLMPVHAHVLLAGWLTLAMSGFHRSGAGAGGALGTVLRDWIGFIGGRPDVATGAEVASFPLEQHADTPGVSFRVTRDGTRLLVLGRAVGGPPTFLQYFALYDTTSGQILARSVPTSSWPPPILDERRGVVLAPLSEQGRVAALDATTLVTLGTLPVDGLPVASRGVLRSFRLLPGRGMTGVYVLRKKEQINPYRCEGLNLDAYDPQGGWSRATVNLISALALSPNN